jgi:hypothetical protein
MPALRKKGSARSRKVIAIHTAGPIRSRERKLRRDLLASFPEIAFQTFI